MFEEKIRLWQDEFFGQVFIGVQGARDTAATDKS